MALLAFGRVVSFGHSLVQVLFAQVVNKDI